MRKQRAVRIMRSVASFLLNFAVFFLTIAFVVTCTFLVFFAVVDIVEEDIRTFAPMVFFNIFVLSALFVISDAIRRKVTIERPVREIQKGLKKLMKGEFDTRISVPGTHNKENRFKDIADSINLLAQELSGVETLRTDFIANVSHEMKTPLAVMQNYGTLLQTPELSEEKRIEYAKSVTETSRKISDLVTNILKLNKLENQQIFPEKKEYDIGEQLCECLIRFEQVWEERNISIDTDIAENVSIVADEELLSLVWNNLFSNAFKFTPDGGSVKVVLKEEKGYVIVTVADTGCGMSTEVGSHIFDKFYQGDSSHTTQGNGLGLALVKRVVDIVQGEIGVESAVGKGSTFTVRVRRS